MPGYDLVRSGHSSNNKRAGAVIYYIYFLPLKLIDLNYLRIHWRLSMILNITKKMYEICVFWCAKKYIFWKCVQYTIHSDKTNIKKISSGENKRYKKCSFLFGKVQLIRVLLLTCNDFMSWIIWVHLSKIVCWILHFWFRFAFSKFYIFVR